ncbi:cytoplasmic dynein 2 intermediate chain 1-like isoform X2 [Littorina saxatilis]|uniref:cytoplasmic dynein 2 intermediate chain 1-like isoform X2 n=1 Tax=Littorina saxatilis TaxID=31220 RepID=UPI0038B4AA4E
MPPGKGPRGELDKKKRSREDDDKKERRRHRDEVNGDDSRRRRHKDDEKKSHKRDEEGHRGHGRSRGDYSPQGRVELTEEEREQLRQERREKRGGDSKKKEDRPRKDEKPVDSEEDAKRRHKREGSARRHRKGDDEEDGERRRRHGDDDGKRHRDKESRNRDKDDDGRNDNDDERERRRQERRKEKEKKDEDGGKDRDHKSKRSKDEDEDRKERHRDREDRHKDRDERRRDRDDKGDGKHRDRGDRDERKTREKDRDKESREEREERKRREREENEREKAEQRRREEEEDQQKKEEKPKGNEDGDDYDDDFEDYEDDFEDEDVLDDDSGRPKKKQSESSGNTVHSNSFMRMLALGNTEREMEEVLRALDEENARLTSLSHRSNWSDSTELSDERFKDGEERPGQQPQQEGEDGKPARPRTVINFVSARQRVLNQSVASKARRRADDLKNMIELDTVFYDMFDLQPVREYDLYIRSFGRSNTKQAYIQTNEDAAEREIQTEEIEDLDKWTQHPAEDLAGVGGDGITVMTGSEEKAVTKENMARVGKFIERAAQVINVLLEEEKGGEEGGGETRERTSNMSLSEGFSQLGCPSFLSGRYVEKVSFCPMQPNTFLTLHSKPQQPSAENPIDMYGLICVWSVKEIASPQKILTCLSQPTCACFSPSRAALVIAGMHDGSVMLWDLREPSSLHRSVYLEGQEIVTRFPTYNTAGVLEKENHHSPVTSIIAVYPSVLRKDSEDTTAAESEGGLSFQLASVEETATVNLWVVTEIPAPDSAGSEVDLGLAPGGRVKLLRSSAIMLNNPKKQMSSGTSRALDIQLNPADLNHFFVASDLGQVIHGVRFGSRVFPRLYQPEIDSPKKITCLDFSPFDKPYFLTGCEDGSVSLYHTSLKHPLSTWSTFCEDHSIVTVQWSRSRPVVFFVLAANSTVYTFDLVQTGLMPVQSDAITSGRVTSLAVASDPALIGGNKALPTHLLFALDNGTAELHTIGSELRQQQPLEVEFLGHYMERF